VPPDLVIVAVRLFTATENDPSIPEGVPDIAVVLPDESVNPLGNITMILPSAGIGFTVVKLTVALPTAAEMAEDGTMLAKVSVPPLVNVLAVTLEALSNASPAGV